MEWWSGRGTVNCNCSVGRRVHPIPAILYARDCEAAARAAARAAAMAALEWWKVKPEGSVYPVGFKTAIGIFKRGGGSEGACTFRAGIRSEAARAQQATEGCSHVNRKLAMCWLFALLDVVGVSFLCE